VHRLEDTVDTGRPDATARRLEQTYAAEKAADSWIQANDTAWESNQVARSEIYICQSSLVGKVKSFAAIGRESIWTRGTSTAPTRSRVINLRKQDSGWLTY
jgi:hypothetical protein